MIKDQIVIINGLFLIMKISREIAIQILKYCYTHKDFYFPFLVMCKESSPEDNDFIEIEPKEWKTIKSEESYQTFELWENLQQLDYETTELLAQGFIEKITNVSLEKHIIKLAKNYRKTWKEKLTESTNIEDYGLNEFIGGKADAFEDCVYLIRKYRGIKDDKNSILWNLK